MWIAPSDFSSSVEIPERMLAGTGSIVRMSSPVESARRSVSATTAASSSATAGRAARRIRMCSAPITSVVSPKIAVPPAATTRSNIAPIAGLPATPEVGSDPPHLTPSVSSETGQGSRRSREAS